MTTHGTNISIQTSLKGLPFKLMAIFKYNDMPIVVSNPRLSLLNADGYAKMPFESIDSLPLNAEHTEWQLNTMATGNTYEITIDPLSLPIGLYKAVFEGEIAAGTKTITQRLEGALGINELSKADRLITTALAILMDNPEEYLFKPQIHQFKASNLFKYMEKAIGWFNTTKPILTNYTIDDLPIEAETTIIDYIIAECLFGKARLGIENDVTINDTRSIQITTHEKYMAMYNQLMTQLNQRAIEHKHMIKPAPNSFRRSRYPLYMMRIVSLMPNFQNVFTIPLTSTTWNY